MMILLGTQLVNKLIQQSIPVAAGYQSRTSASMNQVVVRRSMQERLDEEGLCKIPATIIKQPIHGLHVKGFTQVEKPSK